MSGVRNIIDYINVVSLFHNFYYDYSLVEYKNAHTKIKIICPLHGVFEQTPHNHKKCGCKKCGKLLSHKDVLIRFKKIHSDKYDYSIFKYNGMYRTSNIICRTHGKFEQSALNHLSGKGCPKCASNYKKDKNEIINKLNKLHNNKYDYSKSYFKRTKDIVLIDCPIHGEFEQILNNHLRGHGCTFCDDSKGEREIERYLINNNINYVRQKKFDNCKNKRKLPFDFYLPDHVTCIEYDGEQHFYEVLNWNNLNYTKNNDLIKTNFCISNNINLIRISYNDNIIKKLDNKFSTKLCKDNI
jgi:very-short-patch-repair endonuclease